MFIIDRDFFRRVQWRIYQMSICKKITVIVSEKSFDHSKNVNYQIMKTRQAAYLNIFI